MRLSKDALRKRFLLAIAALVSTASFLPAATFSTPNFIVTAPTPEIAEKCGKTAEYFRKALAEEWLGQEMKRWYKPCTLTVKIGQIGAGGATTFAFDRGEVFGWRMNVQGSLERVLDSVIPHEVSHTVFASHFRRPLPRWADEGAATLIEHESERRRQSMLLKQVWNTPQRIPLSKLLAIRDYPSDMQAVLTLYAEGYSLADFLVQAGGKTRYLEFLETAHRHGWERAIEQHYSLKGMSELENRWNNWVMAGSPQLQIPKDTQLASNEASQKRETQTAEAEFERPIIRAQSPEQPPSSTEEHLAAATASALPKKPSAVPLPKTTDLRQEFPGWRRMREQLKEIPEDFVNPANDPVRAGDLSESAEVQTAVESRASALRTESPHAPLSFNQAETPAAPPRSSNQPAFRFELDEP